MVEAVGFGMNDEDWVYPDESNEKCGECGFYVPCPCGCGIGWCIAYKCFTEELDGC